MPHDPESIGNKSAWYTPLKPGIYSFTGLCGGDLVADYDPKTIESPNYPNNYNNGVTCTWRIRVSFTILQGQKRQAVVSDACFGFVWIFGVFSH